MLAVYLDSIRTLEEQPTEENQLQMEDAKKKYDDYVKDIRSLDEDGISMSFSDKGEVILHDPNNKLFPIVSPWRNM